MSARIFISYSRADEVFARRLATALNNLGADVWIDIEDIPAGMNWSRAIQQGLDSADVMLVIISPASMASENVEDEWQYFMDHGRLVIPILWEPAKIHFQLHRKQYIDFHNESFDAALRKLHTQLATHGIQLAPMPRPDAAPQPETVSSPAVKEGSQQSFFAELINDPVIKRLFGIMGIVSTFLAILLMAMLLSSLLERIDSSDSQNDDQTVNETNPASINAETMLMGFAVQDADAVEPLTCDSYDFRRDDFWGAAMSEITCTAGTFNDEVNCTFLKNDTRYLRIFPVNEQAQICGGGFVTLAGESRFDPLTEDVIAAERLLYALRDGDAAMIERLTCPDLTTALLDDQTLMNANIENPYCHMADDRLLDVECTYALLEGGEFIMRLSLDDHTICTINSIVEQE